MNKKVLKIISRLSAFITAATFSFNTVSFADGNYDYSNPIYSEGINDTFV